MGPTTADGVDTAWHGNRSQRMLWPQAKLDYSHYSYGIHELEHLTQHSLPSRRAGSRPHPRRALAVLACSRAGFAGGLGCPLASRRPPRGGRLHPARAGFQVQRHRHRGRYDGPVDCRSGLLPLPQTTGFRVQHARHNARRSRVPEGPRPRRRVLRQTRGVPRCRQPLRAALHPRRQCRRQWPGQRHGAAETAGLRRRRSVLPAPEVDRNRRPATCRAGRESGHQPRVGRIGHLTSHLTSHLTGWVESTRQYGQGA